MFLTGFLRFLYAFSDRGDRAVDISYSNVTRRARKVDFLDILRFHTTSSLSWFFSKSRFWKRNRSFEEPGVSQNYLAWLALSFAFVRSEKDTFFGYFTETCLFIPETQPAGKFLTQSILFVCPCFITISILSVVFRS